RAIWRSPQRNSRFALMERIAVCPLAFHAMVGSRRKGLKQMLEFIIGLVIGAGAMYAAFKFGYLKL
ncbi:MAG TPA: hypothetical protein VGU64_09160, partial [Terriglobales bacterium]|nr:hypothetical protein [Terriglobales bacterium]